MLREDLMEISDRSENNLEKWVIKNILNESYVREFMINVYISGGESGCISGLVTYRETHAFFDEYYEEIMDVRGELSMQMDQSIDPPIGEDLKNWFAWWAYQKIVEELIEALDIEV